MTQPQNPIAKISVRVGNEVIQAETNAYIGAYYKSDNEICTTIAATGAQMIEMIAGTIHNIALTLELPVTTVLTEIVMLAMRNGHELAAKRDLTESATSTPDFTKPLDADAFRR